VALKVPAGHGVAVMFPGPEAYIPAGACVQKAGPTRSLKVPAAHGVVEVFPLPAS
jgi:hypothetical protein